MQTFAASRGTFFFLLSMCIFVSFSFSIFFLQFLLWSVSFLFSFVPEFLLFDPDVLHLYSNTVRSLRCGSSMQCSGASLIADKVKSILTWRSLSRRKHIRFNGKLRWKKWRKHWQLPRSWFHHQFPAWNCPTLLQRMSLPFTLGTVIPSLLCAHLWTVFISAKSLISTNMVLIHTMDWWSWLLVHKVYLGSLYGYTYPYNWCMFFIFIRFYVTFLL